MELATLTLDVEINRDPCSCGGGPTLAVVPIRFTLEAFRRFQSDRESPADQALWTMALDAVLAEREIMRRLACKRCEL